MAKYPWAKLWIDILDDPKVANMTDKLFRLFIYFLLTAKESHDDGQLPDLDTLAWRIRYPRQEIREALSELIALNVIKEDNEVWYFVNFSKYQDRDVTNSAVRMRRLRYKRKENVTSDVTSDASLSDSDSISNSLIKDSLTKKTIFSTEDAARAYCTVTGYATVPYNAYQQMDNIVELLNRYGWDETISRLTKAKDNWISQKNKTNGASYKLTNPAWIDYAITGEFVGAPPELSAEDRLKEELARIAEATKYNS